MLNTKKSVLLLIACLCFVQIASVVAVLGVTKNSQHDLLMAVVSSMHAAKADLANQVIENGVTAVFNAYGVRTADQIRAISMEEAGKSEAAWSALKSNSTANTMLSLGLLILALLANGAVFTYAMTAYIKQWRAPPVD